MSLDTQKIYNDTTHRDFEVLKTLLTARPSEYPSLDDQIALGQAFVNLANDSLYNKDGDTAGAAIWQAYEFNPSFEEVDTLITTVGAWPMTDLDDVKKACWSFVNTRKMKFDKK